MAAALAPLAAAVAPAIIGSMAGGGGGAAPAAGGAAGGGMGSMISGAMSSGGGKSILGGIGSFVTDLLRGKGFKESLAGGIETAFGAPSGSSVRDVSTKPGSAEYQQQMQQMQGGYGVPGYGGSPGGYAPPSPWGGYGGYGGGQYGSGQGFGGYGGGQAGYGGGRGSATAAVEGSVPRINQISDIMQIQSANTDQNGVMYIVGVIPLHVFRRLVMVYMTKMGYTTASIQKVDSEFSAIMLQGAGAASGINAPMNPNIPGGYGAGGGQQLGFPILAPATANPQAAYSNIYQTYKFGPTATPTASPAAIATSTAPVIPPAPVGNYPGASAVQAAQQGGLARVTGPTGMMASPQLAASRTPPPGQAARMQSAGVTQLSQQHYTPSMAPFGVGMTR